MAAVPVNMRLLSVEGSGLQHPYHRFKSGCRLYKIPEHCSRDFLLYQDYPVSVWGGDKGLLVVGYPRAFTILGAVTVLLISGYRYYRRMRGVPEAIGQLASGGSVHLTCGSPVYQRGRAAKWRHPCDGPAHCAADFNAVSQGNGETCCFLMLFNSIYWSMIDCR